MKDLCEKNPFRFLGPVAEIDTISSIISFSSVSAGENLRRVHDIIQSDEQRLTSCIPRVK